MANTYIWSITGLFCYPQLENKTNVIFNVQWNIGATDGSNNTSVSGTQSLKYMAENPFIAYSDLTQEMIIEWVQTALGINKINEIQINLDNELAALANPPIISANLPWTTV